MIASRREPSGRSGGGDRGRLKEMLREDLEGELEAAGRGRGGTNERS